MAQTRPSTRSRRTGVRQKAYGQSVLKGLVIAVLITAVAVILFALLMQWLRPSDEVIRVVNQLVKLVSIVGGVFFAIGRGGENGLLRGAAIGFLYMAVGVLLYALLSGQSMNWTAYLADLAMGVAGGGITGMLLSNLQKKI